VSMARTNLKSKIVIPAQAGTQRLQLLKDPRCRHSRDAAGSKLLGSRFRGNDIFWVRKCAIPASCQFSSGTQNAPLCGRHQPGMTLNFLNVTRSPPGSETVTFAVLAPSGTVAVM